MTTPGSMSSRILQKVSRTGRDSYYLTSSVLGAFIERIGKRIGGGGSSSSSSSSLPMSLMVKDVLLKEARTNQNSVATSLLRAQQEYGLVRYHGIRPYMQRKIIISSSSSSSSSFWSRLLPPSLRRNNSSAQNLERQNDDTLELKTTSSSTTTAKVAFMITSSMKQQLTDGLGYTNDEIKTMTPQQASLVLFHQVPPPSFQDEIHQLVEDDFRRRQQEKEENEEEERQRQASIEEEETEAVAALRQKQQQQQQHLKEQHREENQTEPMLALSQSSEQPPLSPRQQQQQDETSSLRSTVPGLEVDDKDYPSSSSSSPSSPTEFGTTCYEVVECNAVDGSESRVGLYLDRDEAQLALETRRMIQERQRNKILDDDDENNNSNSNSNNDNGSASTSASAINDGDQGRDSSSERSETVFILRQISKDQL